MEKVMYEIIGSYRGEEEVVDSAPSREEADFMLQEYKKAFGHEWTLYIRVAKNLLPSE